MSSTMTCWKEIAQYVGKGVRTVQRWEQELELPVCRPTGGRKGVVLAHSDEIDAWMHSRFQHEDRSALEALREENAVLRKQNELLRAELKRVGRPATSALSSIDDEAGWMDTLLHRRCCDVIQRNNAIRTQTELVLDTARRTIQILSGEQIEEKSKPVQALAT